MRDKIPVQISREFFDDITEIAKIEKREHLDVLNEVLSKGIQEKKIELAVKLYAEEKISLWKAAKLAGVSLWSMINILKNRKVEINYSKENLKSDILALEAK